MAGLSYKRAEIHEDNSPVVILRLAPPHIV
jgi:hypothetical protein